MVRLRRFSISASVRSILSRASAASFASASTDPSSGSSGMTYGLETTGSGPWAWFTGSSFSRLGSVIDYPLENRLGRMERCWPGYRALGAENQAPGLPRPMLPGCTKSARLAEARSSTKDPANDTRGIIHGRNYPCIVEPGGSDDTENAHNVTGGIAVGRDNGGR